MESKPHERIDLLITASKNIYQTKKEKKSIPMEEKLMKQFGNPPFLREPSLSTNPTISEQVFHDPPLCPNFKNTKHP